MSTANEATPETPVKLLPLWIPVMLVVLRIGRVWVPIPVLLLWPLLLLVWLLAALAVFALSGRYRFPLGPALWHLWCLFGAARGLEVDVRSAGGRGAHPSGTAARDAQPRIFVWVL